MALTKCPDCGKEVSDRSGKCIHCGCPIPNPNIEEENKELEKEYVIGYRAFKPGSVSPLFISGFVLGIVIIVAATLMIPFSVLFALFYIPGLSSLFLGIWFFVTIRANYKKNNECIVYNSIDKTLHLYPIYKDEIIISPNDYIELKDNFWTSNILTFTYDSHDGYKTKVSLGFCENRHELRERLQVAINDCNK